MYNTTIDNKRPPEKELTMNEDFGYHGDEYMLGDCLDDRMNWGHSTVEFWADRMSEDEPDEDEWDDEDDGGGEVDDSGPWDELDDFEVLASAGHGMDEDYWLDDREMW